MEHPAPLVNLDVQIDSGRLLQSLPFAASVVVGTNYRIQVANEAQLRLWQKTAAEVIGKPLFDIIPQAAAPEYRSVLGEVTRSGSAREQESTIGPYFISCTPILSDTGDVSGIICTQRETGLSTSRAIPASISATAPALLSEGFSRSILESSPDCLKVLDGKGSLHFMNENGRCLMEIDDFCLLEHKPWWELWPEESREQVRRSVLSALEGTTTQFQAFCPTAKGTPKWWDVRVSPLLKENEGVEQIIAVSRDITAFKQGETALLNRNRQLDLVARTAQRLIMHNDAEAALLQSVFEDVCESLGLEIFFNFQTNNERGTLHLYTSGGLTSEERKWFATFSFGQHLCGQVAAKKTVIIVEDVANAAHPGSEAIRDAGMTAYAGFPLLAGGILIGTVSFTTRKRTHFQAGEIQTIQAVCDQLSTTIERQRLNRELGTSEQRFRHIFESSPVSKWIEDYTETRRQILELRSAGVTDFESYFKDHPGVLDKLVRSIVIKDVNEAAIDLWGGTKQDLLQGLDQFFVSDTLPAFIEQVRLIANGGGRYQTETVIRSSTGEHKFVLVRIDFPETEDYSNLIVALLDVTGRKTLEEQLKRQYEEIENIYRNAPIGLAIINRDFRFERINDYLAKMHGPSPAAHIGQTLDTIVPGLAAQRRTIFQQVLESGEPALDVEISGQTGAEPGLERIWNESWHPVKNEWGETVAVSVVVEEITQRRKAEEAIRQSEEQMRLVLDASQTGVWIVDLKAMHIYWSTQHYAIFGLTEFDGKIESFQKRVHPDDLPMVWAAFSAAIEQGGQYQSEFRIIRPSGEIRWVSNHGHCEYDAQGQPVRFLGTAQDITRRKEAEQAILENEARFRSLAEALPQMVWTADADGALIFASRHWKEYSGIEDTTEAWHYMVHPDDLPAVMADWDSHFRRQLPYKQQLRLRNRQGEYRWHYSIAEPVRDSEGSLVKWVGAMTDIHAQKTFAEKLEEQVAERTRELQRSNDDLQQFAHVSSHDLKEPVRKVLNFTSRLESEYQHVLPEGARTYLARINAAARRSYEMIEGILHYSKLSTPLTQGGKVDLNTCLRQITLDLELAIEEKSARLSIDPLPVVEGYGQLLHQLFYNLLGNALKFSKPAVPPEISLSWRELPEAEVHELGLPKSKRFICISIRDNGIGFDQRYANRIFHTFARLHTKDAYEGAGIGLSLCKKIAERHGGSIAAEGREDLGASFHVYLPYTLD